jgi:tripartite ATP-independent transporter DctM subunit
MIPPSALAVLLGSLAGIPISDLLIAGIVPGLLMALFFAIYVMVVCTLDPTLAPSYPMPPMSLWERTKPFLLYVLPLLGIFVVVVGSMLAGLATPTESAALGSVASVFAAACYGLLNWANFKKSIIETAKISVMLLFIICASITFAQILTFSDAATGLVEWVKGLVTDKVLIIVAMLAILLFMGCFMDQVSMMMITLPFFMPLAAYAGADPVWFGVLMLILLEIGLITPPFGMILFVMSGIAQDASVPDVYKAALPYIILTLAVVAVIFVWPDAALWLPGLLH